MFDIGFWELTVIAVIGLIVLGPERLPVVARTLGTWVGRAKGYVRGLTSELEREVNVDDIRSQVRRTREQIESDTKNTVSSIRDPLAPEKPQSGMKTEQTRDKSTGASAEQPANPVADAARPESRDNDRNDPSA
ncbi:Sec-independent protein translocase TatB [Salinisphaera dokdonensis CL-ES53]|uniref:Sec-independent protein translocase protein TatB n=1 Tax=Salinisphaera dokdonensis CL-ES53 TaxID=1304272 RepID=A0ABV2B1M9_9GAMM